MVVPSSTQPPYATYATMCICGEVLLEYFNRFSSKVTWERLRQPAPVFFWRFGSSKKSQDFFHFGRLCHLDSLLEICCCHGVDKLCSMYGWHIICWIVEQIQGKPARPQPIRLVRLGGLHHHWPVQTSSSCSRNVTAVFSDIISLLRGGFHDNLSINEVQLVSIPDTLSIALFILELYFCVIAPFI